MFIHELGRELTGRPLAIWEGRSGLPATKEAAYRTLWLARANGEPDPQSQYAEPCTHIGKTVRIQGSERNWHRCNHPNRIELGIAEVTCSCKGCSPRCPGYEA